MGDEKTLREMPVVSAVLVARDAAASVQVPAIVGTAAVRWRVVLDPLELLDVLAERAYDVVVVDRDAAVPNGGLALARRLRASDEHGHIGIILFGTTAVPELGRIADACVDRADGAGLRAAILDVSIAARARRRACGA